MAPHAERSDVQRNRDKLLKTAAEVLTEDPSASMDDIATRAGLARATVYRHVAGRAELLQLLMDHALASAQDAVADAHLDQGPAPEALQRLIVRLVSRQAPFRVLLKLCLGNNPDFIARRNDVLAPVTQLVRRGRDEGSFRADLDPQWATTALITLLQAALAENQADPADLVWATLIEGWGTRPFELR